MDHNVNHKQTHANKDQQTIKKPKYTKTLWPLLGKSQQAYCKAINKDREKTFHKDRSLPAFIFSTLWKVWVSGDRDSGLMMMVLQVSVFQRWVLKNGWWWWWFEREVRFFFMVDEDGYSAKAKSFTRFFFKSDLGKVFVYLCAREVGRWVTYTHVWGRTYHLQCDWFHYLRASKCFMCYCLVHLISSHYFIVQWVKKKYYFIDPSVSR